MSDTQKIKEALSRADANLKSARTALLDPRAPLASLVSLFISIAEDLGYEPYVKWFKAELAGYSNGTLGELIGVDENENLLPDRVVSYRRRLGEVTLKAGNTIIDDLQFPWFFTESLMLLEQSADRNDQQPSEIVIPVPERAIPDSDIRKLVSESGGRLPVRFNAAVYRQILAGLRNALASAASELESAQKFQMSL